MRMFSPGLTGLSKNQLAMWLAGIFLALAVLAGILIQYSYSQLKWETFHQYRLLSEELVKRVDDRFARLIKDEESRSFVDYTFLNVAGDPSAGFVQRSPLAKFPVDTAIPGMVGYFQVDTEGVYSTPMLPGRTGEEFSYGISGAELQHRQSLADRIRQILSQNQLVAVDKPVDIITRMTLVSDVVDEQAQEQDPEGVGFTSGTASEDTPEGRTPEARTPAARRPGGRTQPKKQALAQAAFDSLNKISKLEELTSKSRIVDTTQLSERIEFRDAGTRVEDLDLEYNYQQAIAEPTVSAPEMQANEIAIISDAKMKDRGARQEKGVLLELSAVAPGGRTPEGRTLRGRTLEEKEQDDSDIGSSEQLRSSVDPDIRITTFQSEIDPFEISLLEGGHFVLYRKVWKEGQRIIQGMLIEQNAFLNGVIEPLLRETAIARTSDLVVVYRDSVFAVFRGGTSRSDRYGASDLKGELLYRGRFSAPMGDLELMFLANQLPAGPGGSLIIWVAILLTIVLLGGFMLMYWLGVKQIDLAMQQQDFVSAVSHELNTPLTSIRMYGEMLRDGWAPEEKVRTYYEFICDESERLTRLITNVLQLARMTRHDLKVELEEISVAELIDIIRSKVSSLIERAGFKLNLTCEDNVAEATINVDADYFNQIVINLVDNAIKFSAASEQKDIDICFALQQEGRIVFSIRDYGPGVSRSQIKKIFRLFYRAEGQFIRDTKGTGIGLSLVNQLATAMGATVDVVNKNPGAEFRIQF
jgi:signal transduction histidine kinase